MSRAQVPSRQSTVLRRQFILITPGRKEKVIVIPLYDPGCVDRIVTCASVGTSTPEGILQDPYVFEFVGLEPREILKYWERAKN